MRFRLGTLLVIVTFIAVTVALSYQVAVLQQEIADLRKAVTQHERLLRGSAAFRTAGVRQATTDVGIPYSVEEAMMMDGL